MLYIRSFLLFIVLVLAHSAGFGARAAQSTPGLSSGEVQSAIDFARNKKEIKPYEPSKFIYVYTPFIRVALAARAAFDMYKSFTMVDVTADMIQPVIQIQALASRIPIAGIESFPENVVVMSRGMMEAIQPSSLSGSLSLFPAGDNLSRFAGGASVVATFPLSVLKNGDQIVVIFRQEIEGKARSKKFEQRFKVDLTKWR